MSVRRAQLLFRERGQIDRHRGRKYVGLRALHLIDET
jgi:hypothetical protein